MNTISITKEVSNISLSNVALITGIGLTLMTILSLLAMPAVQTLAAMGHKEMVENIASQEQNPISLPSTSNIRKNNESG
ncbi:hypothetical protein KKI24_17005 [bacterium]|nr:hypothetical protein [bacterium]